MKKSIIWLLTVIMAITFGILLYFQVTYMESMVRMRKEQFTENVMRALYGVGRYLEEQETLFYLEQDAGLLDDDVESPGNNTSMNSGGTEAMTTLGAPLLPREDFATNSSAAESFRRLQDALKYRYRYQQSLLNEVIISIIQESADRPASQRVDSTMVRRFLQSELSKRGMNVPFTFALQAEDGRLLYTTADFDVNLVTDMQQGKKVEGMYTFMLFPNSDVRYNLLVDFPTEKNYIYRSVRYIIPTLVFTAILLVVFLYTIIIAFRQKKLSEMKNDFINNMTHEFKTPISTISLAAQMLDDPSVSKTPTLIKHCSKVINEETKRLRVLVERVLVLSMFDNAQLRVNLSEIDANKVIRQVVSNFKIKAEKFGGSVTTDLKAADADVAVDSVHFTNVIYSLLDNAVKYRKEDEPPHLSISTTDTNSGTELEIRIKDNGIGIRSQDQKRIFERFYRVGTGNRHDVKGYGIGLAYVREVIHQFSGRIRVESEYGEGTTFVITLPLVPGGASKKDMEDKNSEI